MSTRRRPRRDRGCLLREARRFGLSTAIVFGGGLSRAVTLLRVGVLDAPMLLGLTMELLFTPALAQLARPAAPTM
jgi:hypothetical protein